MIDVDFTTMSSDEVETYGRGKGLEFNGSLEKDEMVKLIEECSEAEDAMTVEEYDAHIVVILAREQELIAESEAAESTE